MNNIEQKRYEQFKNKHPKAEEYYYEVHEGSGIGKKIIAVSRYWYKDFREAITDYNSW